MPELSGATFAGFRRSIEQLKAAESKPSSSGSEKEHLTQLCEKEYRGLVREIAENMAAAKEMYVDAARSRFRQAYDRDSFRVPSSSELDGILAKLVKVEQQGVIDEVLKKPDIYLVLASQAFHEFKKALMDAVQYHRCNIAQDIVIGRLRQGVEKKLSR